METSSFSNISLCGNCKYLSITEGQQRLVGSKNNPHICLKYDKQILHGKWYPMLPRLPECIKDNGYVLAGMVEWNKHEDN